jgi:chromosome partitioning protein
MIVTVANIKGGVGKTTININLAIARALKGRNIWLVDGDKLGTAQKAIAIRALEDKALGIPCSTYHSGDVLRTQEAQQKPM